MLGAKLFKSIHAKIKEKSHDYQKADAKKMRVQSNYGRLLQNGHIKFRQNFALKNEPDETIESSSSNEVALKLSQNDTEGPSPVIMQSKVIDSINGEQ